MSYLIKLDDVGTVFSLYKNNCFISAKSLVGDHLQNIAREHGIDVSDCRSESYMLSIIQQYQTVEVE